MKKHNLFIIVFALFLVLTHGSCRHHDKQNWAGRYDYTNKAGVYYSLNIDKNFNYVNYTGNGPGNNFSASCVGKVEGDEFVIYYRQILEDADEGFVKPKNNRVPIIKLYYHKGDLYTEGYNSSDPEVDKGPKLLFQNVNKRRSRDGRKNSQEGAE